jgi:hypothetical protein
VPAKGLSAHRGFVMTNQERRVMLQQLNVLPNIELNENFEAQPKRRRAWNGRAAINTRRTSTFDSPEDELMA